MPENHLPRIALLTCSVFERELARFTEGARHIVETRLIGMELHDRPDHLRAALQEAIDALAVRDDLEAVVLVYALCGLGTAGLMARRHRLVIPRAHDCITLFLGSKEQYAARQAACPTCYYYTPGWNRARRVPGPDKIAALRAALLERFDPEDVEFLLEAEREQWRAYDTAAWLDLGTEDAAAEEAYARRCAEWLGWRFEKLRGDPSLLQALLDGRWDPARFQIVEPGQRLVHSPDASILRAESVAGMCHGTH